MATTNIIPLSTTLFNQFIIGLKSFTSSTGNTALTFKTTVTALAGNVAEVKVMPSINTNTSLTGIATSVVSVLYMLDYVCGAAFPFFNMTSLKCQDGCDVFWYKSITDSLCYPCANTLCRTCDATDSTICLTCQANFVLQSNTCVCDSSSS